MLRSAEEMIKDAQKSIDCVDAEGAKVLRDSHDKAVIIDVREADSVNRAKLSDSCHISRGLLEMKIQKVCPDPNTVILIHCGGGGRASLAALTLRQMGYQRVYAITDTFDHIMSVFEA